MPELLDQLYWHTELVVTDVAKRMIDVPTTPSGGWLAEARAPWDGRSLVVVPEGDSRPDVVVNALAAFEPGVVALGSLFDLAGTQTERLQVLFALTRTGWRVLAATTSDSADR
jgi:hypothetical protein